MRSQLPCLIQDCHGIPPAHAGACILLRPISRISWGWLMSLYVLVCFFLENSIQCSCLLKKIARVFIPWNKKKLLHFLNELGQSVWWRTEVNAILQHVCGFPWRKLWVRGCVSGVSLTNDWMLVFMKLRAHPFVYYKPFTNLLNKSIYVHIYITTDQFINW